jgi:hypothetical protein
MIVGCNLPDVKLLKSFIGIGTEKGSQVFNKTPAYKQITQAASQPPVMTIKEVMFGNFREVPCPFGERAQPIFFRQAVSFRRVGTC